MVHALLSLIPSTRTVGSRERFESEFGNADEEEEEEEGAGRGASTMPADHRNVFGGNNDDCFQMGIAVSRKEFNLYSEFYHADIIIASPLGMWTRMHLASCSHAAGMHSPTSSSPHHTSSCSPAHPRRLTRHPRRLTRPSSSPHPPGLRRTIGAEDERGTDRDFLSSIEVCVLDRADVFHMQNWDHVLEVFRALNCTPSQVRVVCGAHGTHGTQPEPR
jgi:U3 small nucleolar RNA-associated protein 25